MICLSPLSLVSGKETQVRCHLFLDILALVLSRSVAKLIQLRFVKLPVPLEDTIPASGGGA
jgi:hypothetical protein